jgi:hypothetical protein
MWKGKEICLSDPGERPVPATEPTGRNDPCGTLTSCDEWLSLQHVKPFTAQLGDVTFSGNWVFEEGIVKVECSRGGGEKKVGWWQKPGPVAEQLLVRLMSNGVNERSFHPW